MKKLKVKSVKSLGEQQVFDLVMPTNHNFVLENGTVAHNCSYSIVSYNSAFLKKHYPMDFWLAELSAESADRDKLREYSKELSEMILPADILKSHPSEFTIEGDKLRPPLSSLKGVGGAFAANLEKFLSFNLEDICSKKIVKEKAPKKESMKKTKTSTSLLELRKGL
jgi:DNA polymerase-3 subunit alpha